MNYGSGTVDRNASRQHGGCSRDQGFTR